MSLWEKWEREKMERMGIKVERKSDVDIRDTHPKPNFRKQAWIVTGVFAGCIMVVYFALVLTTLYGSRWSDFPIVRALVDRIEQRVSEGRSFR